MSDASGLLSPPGRNARVPGTSAAPLSCWLATTAEERDAIYRLRHAVYTVENGFRPLGSDSYSAWEDELDAKATHLCARAGGVLVGALRVLHGADGNFPAETVRAYDLARFDSCVRRQDMAVVSRFALTRAYRAGSAFLQLFVESARLQQARRVALSFADCQLSLLPLYTALGFQTYQAPYHHPCAGTLVPVVLVAGDLEYLRRIRSPLVELADSSAPPLDSTAHRMRQLLLETVPLRGARSHAARFWPELYAALGRPPSLAGPLAGLSEAELRSLLAPSYLVDFPAGTTIVRSGHPATERWLVLSGSVLVGEQPVPPFSIIGGSGTRGDGFHRLDAVVGERGATLLSIDERKIRQVLGATSPIAERLGSNLHHYGIGRTCAE